MADTDEINDDDNRVDDAAQCRASSNSGEFLVGWEEGLFPSRALTEPTQMEEERLAHVASPVPNRSCRQPRLSRQLSGTTLQPAVLLLDEIPAELVEQSGAVGGATRPAARAT